MADIGIDISVKFPNVPIGLGIPAVLRNPLQSLIPPVALLIADELGIFGGIIAPNWGIFLNGIPIIFSDNVISFDYKQESAIPDFPIENGGFQNYDKVATPFTSTIRFSCGGSEDDRTAFLSSIADASTTLEQYDIVTPEAIYTSVNILGYDYKRTSNNGAGLITVDVHVQEIRISATSMFTQTKSAAGANPTDGGNVQPQAPTTAQQSALSQIKSSLGF